MSRKRASTQKRRRGRQTISEGTEQAFRSYLELLDTASWMRFQLEEQLAGFDLNVEEFRFLELLHREGPMTATAIAERRYCRRQSVFDIAHRLDESGWVKREVFRLPAADVDEKRIQKSLRDRARLGRKAVRLSLTPEGEKLIAGVIPRHAKLVYALMLAVECRQVEALGETCRKLREGDVLKLLNEITMRDPDWEAEEAGYAEEA